LPCLPSSTGSSSGSPDPNGNKPDCPEGKDCSDFSDWFEEHDQMREELGLPESGSPDDGYTLAKLEINGETFWGINSHGQKVDLRVNPISRTHAETDVFNQASRARISGGDGRLVVDRPLCGACGTRGAVRSMAR
jgi:hypothetical protein